MPVFKCFFKIISKNRTSIFIYVGIFTALTLLFSASSKSDQSKNYSETTISIAVIDRDDSKLSKALTGYLSEHNKLVDLPDNTELLQDALFYRNVEYILYVPHGFEKNYTHDPNSALLENVKLPGSTSGIYTDKQIDRYLTTVKAYLSSGFGVTDALANTAKDLQQSTAVEMLEGKQSPGRGAGYYFQYLAYILIALIISTLAPVLIAFNQSDLLRRMESSSLRLRERNVQIAFGCIVTSLAVWMILMLVALLMFGGEANTTAFALQVTNSLVFLAVSISLAFLIGQFFKSTSALSAANNAVALGMSFLCGIFVPQELLGKGVLAVAKFLPGYWYIRSNDMLSAAANASALDMRLYMEGILIQLGFAVAIFAVALVVSRQKKLRPSVRV